MTVEQSLLTSNFSNTDATSYNTASHTPTGNRLVLAAVLNSKAVDVTLPTMAGNGITWVQLATVTFGTIASPDHRLTLFHGMVASPSAGVTTIDFAAAEQTACVWIISEFSGIDTSGTNGSGAVVQSATNNGDGVTNADGLTVTLAAFGSAANATFGAFALRSTGSIAEGTGFTEIAEATPTSPTQDLQTEWRVDNDTSVNAFPSATRDMGGIAIEIKAAAAGVTTEYVAPTTQQLSGGMIGTVNQ